VSADVPLPLRVMSCWTWKQPSPEHQYYRLEAGPFTAGVVKRQGGNRWVSYSVLTHESAVHDNSILACAAIEIHLRKALA
jgi:hypothetical protein